LKTSRPSRIWHILLATSLCSVAAQAIETSPSYPDLLLDDVKHVVTAPARWQAEEWKNLGWASLAVAGTAIVIDGPLRDGMRRQPGDNSFMLNIERFGAEYSVGVIGGFYLAGKLSNNDTALLVAQDSLTASIIASGLVTPALKLVSGRSRPYENAGTNDFQSLATGNHNSSFPSGHTTEAFALASVISAHYEETWIKSTAYIVAGLVGVARTYHDAHFASDVLAGAFIGNWVGQTVVAHKLMQRGRSMALLPVAGRDFLGLRLVGNF